MNEPIHPVPPVPARVSSWPGIALTASLTLNVVILVAVLLLLAGRCHSFGHRPPEGGGPGCCGGPVGTRMERFARPPHGGWEGRDEERGERRFGSREEEAGRPGGDFRPEGPSGERPPGAMADRMLDRLGARLSLTEPQKAQIRPILEQAADGARKAIEQSRQAARAKIRAVLTPDQQKQFDQMAEKAPGERPGNPARP